MILASQLTDIGATLKTHGINGEISATVDAGIDLTAIKCIIFDMDGIFVPFFIKSSRLRGSEAVLISIDGIENERQAAELCPKTIYALSDDIPDDNDDEDGFYLSDLIGLELFDDNQPVGTITDFDDSTENLLIIVDTPDKKGCYIPLADDLIKSIDYANRRLTISIANGLLEL